MSNLTRMLIHRGEMSEMIDTLVACLIGLSVWTALLVGIGAA